MPATNTPAAASTRNRVPGETPDRGVHNLIVGTGDNVTTYGCALSRADIGRAGTAPTCVDVCRKCAAVIARTVAAVEPPFVQCSARPTRSGWRCRCTTS